MFILLQIVTLTLITVALSLSLAHALELPGKMRLDRKTYYAVQGIYYPGFTVGGGVGEGGSTIAILLLLFLTPGGNEFWLTFIALLGLIAMQAVYWLITHPVNRFWVEGMQLNSFSVGFSRLGANTPQNKARAPDWTALRDRWEYSHVARAGCALISFVALAVAISPMA